MADEASQSPPPPPAPASGEEAQGSPQKEERRSSTLMQRTGRTRATQPSSGANAAAGGGIAARRASAGGGRPAPSAAPAPQPARGAQTRQSQAAIASKEKAKLIKLEKQQAKEREQMHFDFMRAAAMSDLAKMRALHEKNVDVNYHMDDGWTALLHASSKGNVKVVKCLLEMGADPNQADRKRVVSPLAGAINSGKASCVQALLEAGADAKKKVGQVFPLQLAAAAGNKEMMGLLVTHGADPDKLIDGQPLHSYAPQHMREWVEAKGWEL